MEHFCFTGSNGKFSSVPLQPQRQSQLSSQAQSQNQGSVPAPLYSAMMISQPGQPNVLQISTSLAQNNTQQGAAVATFTQDRQIRYVCSSVTRFLNSVRAIIDISVTFLPLFQIPCRAAAGDQAGDRSNACMQCSYGAVYVHGTGCNSLQPLWWAAGTFGEIWGGNLMWGWRKGVVVIF